MAVYIRRLLTRARVSVIVGAGVAAVYRTAVVSFDRIRAQMDRKEEPRDERHPNAEMLAREPCHHRRYVTGRPGHCQIRPLDPLPGQASTGIRSPGSRAPHHRRVPSSARTSVSVPSRSARGLPGPATQPSAFCQVRPADVAFAPKSLRARHACRPLHSLQFRQMTRVDQVHEHIPLLLVEHD